MADAAATPAAPDAAVRTRALQVEQSFLVRAPAGSGKTELLSQRVLALLAEVDEPEAIVAVTFTRKAAAEMRNRILQALEAAAGPEPGAAHARLTWRLAQRARARDRERGWGLLQLPVRLRITTLDSLALSLVARMPWLSRMGGVPQPTEEAEALYRAAARRVLARVESPTDPAQAAARALLLRCDNDWERAETGLADLLAHRDQWLPLCTAPAAEAGGEAARLRLERAFLDEIERQLAALRAVIAASPGRDALVRLAADAAPRSEAASPVRACAGLTELPGATVDDLSAWHGLAELVLTKEGTPRKQRSSALGLTGLRDTQRLKGVLLGLGSQACQALHRTRPLQPLPLGAEAWERLTALLQLLPLAAAELQVEFAERNTCDFVAITAAARTALGEAAAPTTLAFALDGRIRHLLVDEFQDTSAAQFDLLQRLVRDWQPGDGRTVFLVGDPMQSIFLFRHARVDLFLRAPALLRPLVVEPLQLSANFRSQAGLVAWCNQRFAAVFPAHDAPAGGEVAFCGAEAMRPALAPAVVLHPVTSKKPELEAQQLAALAAEELAASPAGTIAILAEKRRHLRSILPALRARGIRYQGMDLEQLADSPVAADLLALAQAVLDPTDRVAWLALLRAPWCGLTLAELHQLAGGDASPQATVLELFAQHGERLPPPARARAERVLAIAGAAGGERGRRPLRTLVEWCWQQLGGPQCLRAADNPAEVEAILAAFECYESEGEPGLRRALAAAMAPPNPLSGVRVQVMTMHHAKGLEFDCVFLPGLNRAPGSHRERSLSWLECAAPNPGDDNSWLLAARAERGADNPHGAYIQQQLAEREREEKLRLLYVAATRARQRLHLFAALPLRNDKHPPRPAGNTLLGRLWPAVETEFLAALPGPEKAESELVRLSALLPQPALAPAPLRRVPTGWAPPAPEPSVAVPAALTLGPPPSAMPARHHAASLTRHIGTAVHALLQRIAGQLQPVWPATQLRFYLLQAGVAASDLPQAQTRAAAALNRMLADPRGRWILAPHEDAHNEWELTSIQAAGLRDAKIDRSFVEAGVRWIIDYKTSFHEGAGVEAFLDEQVQQYRPQLESYASLLAALESRPNRCALYFPLLAEWRELVP